MRREERGEQAEDLSLGGAPVVLGLKRQHAGRRETGCARVERRLLAARAGRPQAVDGWMPGALGRATGAGEREAEDRRRKRERRRKKYIFSSLLLSIPSPEATRATRPGWRTSM